MSFVVASCNQTKNYWITLFLGVVSRLFGKCYRIGKLGQRKPLCFSFVDQASGCQLWEFDPRSGFCLQKEKYSTRSQNPSTEKCKIFNQKSKLREGRKLERFNRTCCLRVNLFTGLMILNCNTRELDARGTLRFVGHHEVWLTRDCGRNVPSSSCSFLNLVFVCFCWSFWDQEDD